MIQSIAATSGETADSTGPKICVGISRRRAWGFAIVACGGALIGVLMGLDGLWIGYAVTILLSLVGMLLFVAPIIPRFQLQLTSKGFTYGNLRRIHCIQWSEVEAFRVFYHRSSQSRPQIVWNFKRPAERPHIQSTIAFNQKYGAYDAQLPNLYKLNADQLLQLLESYRSQFTDSTDDQ